MVQVKVRDLVSEIKMESEEVAQWIKCLLSDQEDQSSGSPWKAETEGIPQIQAG